MRATTPYAIPCASGLMFALPITILFGVGTNGGSFNDQNVYSNIGLERIIVGSSATDKTVALTPANEIGDIKEALKLTTTELAKYLGVSRQTIYDWQSGAHIKPHNVTKLENLKAAADVILAAQIPSQSLLIQRKLSNGRTLLETVAAGGDGQETAKSLVRMLQREAQDRIERNKRIEGRSPVADSAFGRGIAMLREGG